jgi:hypothetical protein
MKNALRCLLKAEAVIKLNHLEYICCTREVQRALKQQLIKQQQQLIKQQQQLIKQQHQQNSNRSNSNY